MRMIDLDKFLVDLSNECFDVRDLDTFHYDNSKYGYSYDLIERVAERQAICEATDTGNE